jgi:hypothetical protein
LVSLMVVSAMNSEIETVSDILVCKLWDVVPSVLST